MRHSRCLAVACLVLISAAWTTAGPAQETSRWDAADAAIVRLPPSDFAELPDTVARELQRRNCTVPQPWELFISSPANVISGEFRKPGQTDWAVLCSVDRMSSLLIFWNGSADRVEQLGESAADRGGLQVVREDEIGYSIAIHPVGEAYILDHYEAYGGPEPPPIDHQGINFAFIEKASVMLYWHGGEWLRLQGAD
jgi:hypothetical protein